MRAITATTRVTVGLVCLSVSVWLLATMLGIVPNSHDSVVAGRAALCEAVAIQSSLLASRHDHKTIKHGLTAIAQRNPDILSAGIRQADGSLLVQVGNHAAHWNQTKDERSTDSRMHVPIMDGPKEWGSVEFCFRGSQRGGFISWLSNPLVALVIFVSSASYLLYFFYLRRMLQHLDPSKVIPPRVRSTLDTLAEGLLVLDKDERIVLANRAFTGIVGQGKAELVGRRASELPWENSADEPAGTLLPWSRAIRDGLPQIGNMLLISDANERTRIFKVNAAPILGDDGSRRGALASFDDVTQIEENRAELRAMLEALRTSRDEIHRQNQELEELATRDPLTSCLNRRAFFSELETTWTAAERYDLELSCIMVDVDHFKAINDAHGHTVGDVVLQRVSGVLRSKRRGSDFVCRYGGEEFCVLLPHTDIQDAALVAELIRHSVQSSQMGQVSVTISVGVSARGFGAEDPQALIDQADKCLYLAKNEGRNRVVRWDQAADRIASADDSRRSDSEAAVAADAPGDLNTIEANDPSIPFHAVTALVSALAYRDAATANHSRRVADLCVATAQGLMSAADSYILEIAALLHDIGKIGVPDSILLKPGPLDEDEWKVMSMHERVGVEIVQTTFSNAKLHEIISTHHSWFGGHPRHPELPTGDEIPVGARILAIADAYDAIVSDRVYRKARTRDEAFAELRRCTGRQFDAALVERFIDVISSRDGGQELAVRDASKEAAIGFGIQIERLATALENQDFQAISALANRLNLTARKYNVPQIAQLAAELEQAAAVDSEMMTLVALTSDLLELCRSAQRAYLEQCNNPAGEPSVAVRRPVLLPRPIGSALFAKSAPLDS